MQNEVHFRRGLASSDGRTDKAQHMKRTQLLVRGEIVFESSPMDLSDAKIYVRLEDTSFADEESDVLVQKTLTHVKALMTPQGKIPFSLYGELPNLTRSYSVSVHVDLQSNGKISTGDFINMENYPVTRFGHGKPMRIQVKLVKGDKRITQ